MSKGGKHILIKRKYHLICEIIVQRGYVIMCKIVSKDNLAILVTMNEVYEDQGESIWERNVTYFSLERVGECYKQCWR